MKRLNKSPNHSNSRGFTLLELMIATMIFSVILLLCAYGLVRIGNMYYHGITSSRTQSVARAASDDVVQAIQYGHGNVDPTNPPVYDGNAQTVNVGSRSYSYTLGRALVDGTPDTTKQSNSVLKATDIGDDGKLIPKTTKELLAKGMWLAKFAVVKDGPLYKVEIKVVHGDIDQVEDSAHKDFGDINFDIDSLRCKSGNGSQFCAVSSLYTEAFERL